MVKLMEVAVWLKAWKLAFSRPTLFFGIKRQAFTHYCHLNGASLAQQIYCDKVLFSHTRRWYQFPFFPSPSLSLSLPPSPSLSLSLSLSLFFSLNICYLYTVFCLSAELIITRKQSSKKQLSKDILVTAYWQKKKNALRWNLKSWWLQTHLKEGEAMRPFLMLASNGHSNSALELMIPRRLDPCHLRLLMRLV